jgi:transcriptional regulator with GAF, ATPase, and Fis domain
MGQKSQSYFEEAERSGGLVAKMKLASSAQLTSAEAAVCEDTPEIIQRLERAISVIRAESAAEARRSQPSMPPPLMPSVDSEAKVLRGHLRTYLELMTQRSLFLSDLQTTIRRIDEAAATTLRVERVSVWFLDSSATKITCADLFQRSTRAHSSGTELFAKDFAAYFRALRTQRTIAANDAHTDPGTSCFSEVYLKPLGINSMLDVPILHEQKMVGVICHEHVGPPRTWNSDDENFAYLMSNFVALALEKRGTRPVPG